MKTAITWGGILASLAAIAAAAADPTPEKIGLAAIAVYNLFAHPPTAATLEIPK